MRYADKKFGILAAAICGGVVVFTITAISIVGLGSQSQEMIDAESLEKTVQTAEEGIDQLEDTAGEIPDAVKSVREGLSEKPEIDVPVPTP